ncbi:MAG: efflux RND transporter periplasmic adaptor subunit [Thermodesulfobacteriota bacterium]|jgi:Cu(I)/Ag(I) efflux system membrane fusion protein|nr:MAG: efflux RND transporter periplasmic adaptor subunit [Thermodesulfobacteriota bacterium]
MKPNNLIIDAQIFLTIFLICFFPPDPLMSHRISPIAYAQTSSMPGMPGMSSETPQPASTAPSALRKETAEVPSLQISPEKQQLIGVKTVEASVKSLEKTIRTVGRIEYDEKKLATVNTKIEGWIEKLFVDYTGKQVKKGAPLVEIYSPELFATQQEFINLVKWNNTQSSEGFGKMLSQDSQKILEAARERLRLWDITNDQIKKIEKTGKPIRRLRLYSPVSGYVVQKMALQGMRVMPGEKLFDVADLSTVWVIADIYEYELSLVKVGEIAKINLSYFPEKEFESSIDYIYPTLAGETRTTKIRFTIPNPEGKLKPNMFTDVVLKISLGTKLVIPEDALIDTGVRQIVYIDKGEGYFEPREVVPGARGEGMIEIIKGLYAGEKVASAANFLIDSEAKLNGVVPLHQH